MTSNTASYMQSVDSEMAILCCCITYPDLSISKCLAAGVQSDWFYKMTHQIIWDSIVSMSERSVSIDELTICDDLQANDNLDKVGGFQQISSICGVVETPNNVHSYIDILNRCFMHRKVARLSSGIVESVHKPYESVKSLKEAIQSDLSSLNGISVQEKDESLVEVADQLIDQAEREYRGEKDAIDQSRWIHWGLPTIDESFGPMDPDRRDNLIVVAGRPGEGKTALASNIALLNVKNDKIVVIFTLETTREDLIRQFASIEAQYNTRLNFEEARKEFRYGEESVVRYMNAMKMIRSKCEESLFIFEDDLDLNAIESRIREIKARVGRIDLIVVDYLQLVEVHDKNLVREQQVAKVSRRFKLIAKEMNNTLILAAQLNRDYNEKEGPALRNLRESGSIEQDADRVIFTWRPKEDANGCEQTNRAEFQQKLVQAKMKNGPRLWRWVVFKPATTTFKDVPDEERRGRPKGS